MSSKKVFWVTFFIALPVFFPPILVLYMVGGGIWLLCKLGSGSSAPKVYKSKQQLDAEEQARAMRYYRAAQSRAALQIGKAGSELISEIIFNERKR
jgi:hypothetical protein